MNPWSPHKKRNVLVAAVALLGLLALHNQRLIQTDPENTYGKRIKRTLRLWLNPADTVLQEHLTGKGIACENGLDLYQRAAAATVVINTGKGIGAGVFIGPQLIVTAKHVVEGPKVEVTLPTILDDALARPGRSIPVDAVKRIKGLDLAFVTTREAYPQWLSLATRLHDEPDLMVIGHPNGKYYSLQKARIKRKSMLERSPLIFFKDNEIFFGNSGGTIVNCRGELVGVVSMMSNYQDSLRKRGIGINARTILQEGRRQGFSLADGPASPAALPRWG